MQILRFHPRPAELEIQSTGYLSKLGFNKLSCRLKFITSVKGKWANSCQGPQCDYWARLVVFVVIQLCLSLDRIIPILRMKTVRLRISRMCSRSCDQLNGRVRIVTLVPSDPKLVLSTLPWWLAIARHRLPTGTEWNPVSSLASVEFMTSS